jgi:CMP-N,N'-diacetyllegionaminic acid synthase
MEIMAIIPARGGSKGIPLKNLKLLNGKPLIDYSINSSIKSKFITRTIVSSDHSKILKKAEKLGAEIIKRPKNLATDSSQLEPVIDHCLNYLKRKENYIPDIIILLQNTSPLRTKKHIDDALSAFLDSKFDSMMSCYSSHYFLWTLKKNTLIPKNHNPKNRPNRQQMNNQFIENGAIYITRYNAFKKSHCRISGKIGLFEMQQKVSIDIDTKSDLLQANKFLKYK